MLRAACAVGFTLSSLTAAIAADVVPVTVDSFIRAETDTYFGKAVKEGGLGKFIHARQPADIDHQTVIRMNRDTIYSQAVFDLDAGPVTVTLPDSGNRFMSMQVINEDHYTQMVVYGAGRHVLTREQIGTRYVFCIVRILVDPAAPGDLEAVHSLQDGILVEQASSGAFEVPTWDEASQSKIRDALLVLGTAMPDSKGSFGRKEEVDPVRHLIGTAVGWGGNPDKDAFYLLGSVPQNDGSTKYTIHVGDVPVDGFWSISVYNAKGFFQKNDLNAYSLNNLTAEKNVDGSVDVQFGGCNGKTSNCLPITAGWNYAVRLYRPRAEVLDGQWQFPDAVPAT